MQFLFFVFIVAPPHQIGGANLATLEQVNMQRWKLAFKSGYTLKKRNAIPLFCFHCGTPSPDRRSQSGHSKQANMQRWKLAFKSGYTLKKRNAIPLFCFHCGTPSPDRRSQSGHSIASEYAVLEACFQKRIYIEKKECNSSFLFSLWHQIGGANLDNRLKNWKVCIAVFFL